VDQAEIDRLNPIMARAISVAYFLQQAMADPAKLAAMAQGMGLDLSNLPAGVDLLH
jgi:hypothetical protein